MRFFVPTRIEIIRLLDRLSELASNAATIAEVEDELISEFGALICHVNNRACIETGKINEE